MSPQKENGFTPIANELFEAFYRCKLLEYERCVVMCVWRKTYGWSKKEDWISLSQMEIETGISKCNISRVITRLINKKIIQKNGKKISVNKKYKEWEVEWRGLSHQTTGVVSPDNKRLSHQTTTKERKQTTNTISDKSPLEKDMVWNKQVDDEVEISIDIDSGEEIKPKQKPKRNYKEVFTTFEEVLGKLPANWFVNTTQQKCADNLFTERGIKAIRNALKFYKENKDQEFCPQITQPSDLDAKWTKLGEFKKKLQ